MVSGLTEHIDLTLVILYAFWIFFGLLIFHLQQESRREGYPLESETTGKAEKTPVFFVPEPKNFLMSHGRPTVTKPDGARETRPLNMRSLFVWAGSPASPTGNPMLDGIGPGAYAERADTPDLTHHGDVKIIPMRTTPDRSISPYDPNPIGMEVVGCDRKAAGQVVDVWIDTAENLIRYYEVTVPQRADARTILLPAGFAVIRTNARGGDVYVHAITSSQFSDVPVTMQTEQVTLFEEDKICGYFGGGLLYATPSRTAPLI